MAVGAIGGVVGDVVARAIVYTSGDGPYLSHIMSLIGFHKLLIATAILFCALFAVWQGMIFTRTGAALNVALAAAFALAAAGFTYYLANLQRFLKRDS